MCSTFPVCTQDDEPCNFQANVFPSKETCLAKNGDSAEGCSCTKQVDYCHKSSTSNQDHRLVLQRSLHIWLQQQQKKTHFFLYLVIFLCKAPVLAAHSCWGRVWQAVERRNISGVACLRCLLKHCAVAVYAGFSPVWCECFFFLRPPRVTSCSPHISSPSEETLYA